MSPLTRARHLLAFAVVTAVAGACSSDLVDPSSSAVAPGGPSLDASVAGQPPLTSNAVKYRDGGARPATGRSGSATLAARALLAKDGTTTLEVTTGTFDPVPTAPRELLRLQVKHFAPDGTPLRTINHNDLGGAGQAELRYSGLTRGSRLQLQGNVSEPGRTDVVTVNETVHLAPDLRPILQAPERAAPGLPVTLAATISEGNGDVGARADCVLYVDGAEADRAAGIWVDAGDAVACAFTHVFAAAGTRHLRVSVERVSPADFEPANNDASATIQIEAPAGSDFLYSAFVDDYVEQSVQRDSFTFVILSDGEVREAQQEIRGTTRVQSGALYATTYHGVSLPATTVRLSQSTRGATVHAGEFVATGGHQIPGIPDEPGCMSRWSPGAVIYLCSAGTADEGMTSLQYVRGGVAVTYHGVSHGRNWYPDAPENVYTYTNEWTGGYVDGEPQITIGPDYSFSVELADGDRSYRLNVTVPLDQLEQSTWTYYPPTGEYCRTEENEVFRFSGCGSHLAEITARRGFRTGEPD